MPRKIQAAPIDGVLVLHKPQGKTSHDVVAAARRVLGFRQIGHLGTLDPLATGVLVLLLGRATRLAQFYVGRRKRYACTFRFGFATDTYDSQGVASGPDTAPILDRAEIERMVAERIGRFAQMPPAYSAKKIQGRPAYELARLNKPVELRAAEVEIYDFSVREVTGSCAKVSLECSSGTYVRSLAHDMGAALGCGAHLTEIVRTAVGEFTLDQAATIEEIERGAAENHLSRYVIPLEKLLPELPSITVLPQVEQRICHGAKFDIQIAQIEAGRVSLAQGATTELNSGEWKPARLRVFSQAGRLIAIAEPLVLRTYRPILVLESAG